MADKARRMCIVSRALAGTDITLSTKLLVASR
jgi:organic hydroperoxide reductase OsmC/OhrA